MIGIVSYHREPNYGTMLQAYALAKAIDKLGVKCEYIQYRGVSKKPWLKYYLHITLAKVYHFIRPPKEEFGYFQTTEFSSIYKRFKDFHRYFIPCSSIEYCIDTIKQANERYDCFIVGSDQTWSRYMNRLPSSINFLPFVEEKSKKKSYAPSIGSTHIDDKEFLSRLIKELSGFESLSCREKENCEYLTFLLGREVKYVIDPTLLLCPSDWDTISIFPEMKGGYILAYILGVKKCVSDYAERLGKEKGLPVYYILTRPEYLSKEHVLDSVGPQEFIGYIKSASYIVTDSFHGSIFSINYGRNFYSFAKRTVALGDLTYDNDRIISFLNELQLTNRFKKDDDYSFEPDIDYNPVNEKLEVLRESSWGYLKKILQ